MYFSKISIMSSFIVLLQIAFSVKLFFKLLETISNW